MQSITRYKIPAGQQRFTLSMPQYSHCLDIDIDFEESLKYKVIFSIVVLSDDQWPIVEREFYLFKEGELFNLYSGIEGDYYLPVTYIGNIVDSGNYYLFVRDEGK